MTIDELKHLAGLARMDMDETELMSVGKDMEVVLAYVDQIREVAKNLDEKGEISDVVNVMRSDGNPTAEGVYTEAVLENAPYRDGQFVKVKKIL
ncbi:MAG: Asp-tRNA(Asn)/Glu-tRNA(Gln) amidotransferase subunit GatC [Minisyncoccia bacterium]